jgi:hypothetical protein
MKNWSKEIVMPCVHMNGDSEDTLKFEWNTFLNSALKLIEDIPSHSFHGRNHYTKGDELHQQAREALEELQGVLGTIRMTAEDVVYELEVGK